MAILPLIKGGQSPASRSADNAIPIVPMLDSTNQFSNQLCLIAAERSIILKVLPPNFQRFGVDGNGIFNTIAIPDRA